MSVNFQGGNSKQPYLFSPSVEDWLPRDHLARFVVEIVDQLDISRISSKYGGRDRQGMAKKHIGGHHGKNKPI